MKSYVKLNLNDYDNLLKEKDVWYEKLQKAKEDLLTLQKNYDELMKLYGELQMITKGDILSKGNIVVSNGGNPWSFQYPYGSTTNEQNTSISTTNK